MTEITTGHHKVYKRKCRRKKKLTIHLKTSSIQIFEPLFQTDMMGEMCFITLASLFLKMIHFDGQIDTSHSNGKTFISLYHSTVYFFVKSFISRLLLHIMLLLLIVLYSPTSPFGSFPNCPPSCHWSCSA